MYAHQVIDDLEKYPFSVGTPENIISDISALLFKSIKFNFGEITDVPIFQKPLITKDQMKALEKYFNLPYPTCWFEMLGPIKDGTHRPRGFLINKTNNNFIIYPFFKNHSNLWIADYILQLSNDLQKIYPSHFPGLYDTLPESFKKYEEKTRSKTINNYIHQVVLLTIFLNCKNVVTEKIKAPDKLNKKRRKANKSEIFDYHILKIKRPGEKENNKKSDSLGGHYRQHKKGMITKDYVVE